MAAITLHPIDPILAIAGSEGYVLLWNYIEKETILHHYVNMEKEEPTTMMFTPDGMELLIGTTNATVLVLDYENNLNPKAS